MGGGRASTYPRDHQLHGVEVIAVTAGEARRAMRTIVIRLKERRTSSGSRNFGSRHFGNCVQHILGGWLAIYCPNIPAVIAGDVARLYGRRET